MGICHITVVKNNIIENSKYYNTAFLKDDLSKNYGEHHFITTLGEVAIIDLLPEKENGELLMKLAI